MEGNKDEAVRCLAIAQRHRDSENWSAAKKFCQKSLSLFSTPEAEKLLASIVISERTSSSTTTNKESSSASGAESRAGPGAKQRNAAPTSSGTASGMGGEKREFTAEQHSVVKRVRGCKVTEYYEILAVKRSCEDAEIKKAYRKVRVQMIHKLYDIN